MVAELLAAVNASAIAGSSPNCWENSLRDIHNGNRGNGRVYLRLQAEVGRFLGQEDVGRKPSSEESTCPTSTGKREKLLIECWVGPGASRQVRVDDWL